MLSSIGWAALLLPLLPLLLVVAAVVALAIGGCRRPGRKTLTVLLITLCLLTFGIYVELFDVFAFGVTLLVPMTIGYLISLALIISSTVAGVNVAAARRAGPRRQVYTGVTAGVLGIVIGQIAVGVGVIAGLILTCARWGDCV